MKLHHVALAVGLAALVGWAAGCGEKNPPVAQTPTANKHEDRPPHGGTALALGNEDYQLELVLDKTNGIMNAYLLDGEMENFVRIPAESFAVTAKLPAGTEVLDFKSVANRATGETAGDTSMFSAQADWLKSVSSFDGSLKELTVKGSTYTNVTFNFPKGNGAK